MVRHRISTVFAVACAVLGAAALITGTGVLFESGLRSHLPADRLGGADVVVSAQQSVRTPGDIDSALPVRRTVRADFRVVAGCFAVVTWLVVTRRVIVRAGRVVCIVSTVS